MPYKALSQRVKAAKRAQKNEEKLQEAIEAYTREQDKPDHLQKGAQAIAAQFGILE